MKKISSSTNKLFSHPQAVTYALSFLLTLSILALIVVVVNCSHNIVLIDVETGEVVSGEMATTK